MPAFPLLLLDWFRTHHGIVNTTALKHLRVPRRVRDDLVAAGVLEVVYEGVYRLRASPITFESRCAAICAADRSLVITCASAGRLWGFRTCSSDEIHAVTTRTTRPIIKDVVLHRCPVMPRAHIVRRADGIRLTHAARVLFDEARHRNALQLESLMEDAINQGRCTVQKLYEVGRDLCHPGRPGSVLFAEVLRSRPAWRRPVDSHPELVLRDAVARAGVELETQVALELPDGRTIHPDLGDPEILFFVEIDDPTWHGGRVAGRHDRERDRLGTLAGAVIARVSTDEIEDSLTTVVDQLVGAYRLRQAQASRRGA